MMASASLTFCVLILSTIVSSARSADILFIVGPVSSYSHRAGIEPLAIALAEKGHNVTFLSPIPSKSNNSKINEFCPKTLLHIHEAFHKEFGVLGLQSRLKKRKSIDLAKGFGIFDTGVDVTQALLQDEDYQHFFKTSTFQLVVIDGISMTEVFYGLAWKLQAKVITYNALGMLLPWDHYAHGVPVESWIPMFDVPYDEKTLSFMNRVWNEISILSWYYSALWYYFPKLDALLKEGYGELNMPSVLKLVQNASLIFANQHYSDAFPKSLPPFVIPVGGMTTKPSDGVIPQHLDNFVNDGDQGFVYISFGSIITISSLPPDTLQVFYDAISKFDLKFLWKWEGELPKNGPKNVLFRNWFPQNDVLAHPKLKGFISQGGQVSLQQAIYHGVPLILFPVNGDQNLNAKRLEIIGNGLTLEFCDLAVSELSNAIHQITANPSYRKIASKLSSASKNRPITSLDTALWWTEFTLSQNDLYFLKPLINNQSWWSQRQLDVFAFLFLVLSLFAILVITLSYIFLNIVINKLTFTSKTAPSASTSKKQR